MDRKVVLSTRWMLLVVVLSVLPGLALPSFAVAAQEEPLRVCLNIWIIADSGTQLSQSAQFADENVALGEPTELVRTVLAEESLPRLNQIWGQCAIGFRLNIAKVMRLDKITVGGETLDKQLLGTVAGGEARGLILTGFDTFNLLFEALRAVEKELPGHEIGKVLFRCLNVFIVGEFLTPDGARTNILGVALLFDPRSMVRWREPGVAGLANVVMAHEIGHNFGLGHADDEGLDDPRNLMNSRYSVHNTNLLPVQCRIARRTILLRNWAEGIVNLLWPHELAVRDRFAHDRVAPVHKAHLLQRDARD